MVNPPLSVCVLLSRPCQRWGAQAPSLVLALSIYVGGRHAGDNLSLACSRPVTNMQPPARRGATVLVAFVNEIPLRELHDEQCHGDVFLDHAFAVMTL